MNAGPPPGRIVLAVVTGAHGIRGEVKLRSFAEDPEAMTDYGALERSDAGEPLRLIDLKAGKGGLIARFEGITDRNAAEALKGVELWLPRERLPAPAEDEFYHADLIGLAVERGDGSRLGDVVAVHNFGAGDLLEVRTDSGDTVLLPFTRTTVPVVDPASGRLVIEPPEGLLD